MASYRPRIGAMYLSKIINDYDVMFQVNIYTVLFLDEANTTEAIGLVKELLCDRRMNGTMLDPSTKLRIIAACNPYKRSVEITELNYV